MNNAKKKAAWCILAAGIVFGCCSCVFGPVFLLEAIATLATGWVSFLARVVFEMEVDWGGTSTAVVALAGLIVGMHLFLRWLFGEVQKMRQSGGSRTWQMRWTAGILGVVMLMFVAGIAAVGMTHQTVWLLSSPDILTYVSIRRQAAQTNSLNYVKIQGLSALNYQSVYKQLPAGGTFSNDGRGLHGWQIRILPFIESSPFLGDLYTHVNFELPWDHPANSNTFRHVIPFFQYSYVDLPQRDGAAFALSHYAGNVRVMGGGRPLNLDKDFPDGSSNTLLLGEAAGNYRCWGHYANWRDPALGINTTPDGFGNPSPRGFACFVMADGSVRTLSNRTSPEVLKALSTPAGGEKLPDNWDDN